MKIGILSDTHNYKENTRTALSTFRERGITRLIHCGDITTPEMIALFSGWQVTFVLGNMDTMWSTDLRQAALMTGVQPPRLSAEVEIDGKQIGVTHGADGGLLLRMTMSGKYDYLCRGHTHRRLNEYQTAYGVRLINPGALGGNRPEARSICILDVETGEVEFILFGEMA